MKPFKDLLDKWETEAKWVSDDGNAPHRSYCPTMRCGEMLALIACIRAADAWLEADRINLSGARANVWDAIDAYREARAKLDEVKG